MYTSLFKTQHRRKSWRVALSLSSNAGDRQISRVSLTLFTMSQVVTQLPVERVMRRSVVISRETFYCAHSRLTVCSWPAFSEPWRPPTSPVWLSIMSSTPPQSSLRRNHCITILQYGIRRKCVISNKFWCVVTFDCINQDLPRTWESYPSTIYQNACLSVCLSVCSVSMCTPFNRKAVKFARTNPPT